MQLSEHFSLEEATHSDTATRLGISNQPDAQQLENMKTAAAGMEKVRALLGKSINVNSWIRLPEVNVAVGGSKISSHMDGWAIDFVCKGFGTPLEVCKAIDAAGIKFDQSLATRAGLTSPLRQQCVSKSSPSSDLRINTPSAYSRKTSTTRLYDELLPTAPDSSRTRPA